MGPAYAGVDPAPCRGRFARERGPRVRGGESADPLEWPVKNWWAPRTRGWILAIGAGTLRCRLGPVRELYSNNDVWAPHKRGGSAPKIASHIAAIRHVGPACAGGPRQH